MVVHPSRILIGHDPVAEAAAWRNERPKGDDPPSGDLPQTQPQRPKCDGPKGANSANPTFNSRSNPREIKDLGVCVTDYGYRYYHPELGRWLSKDPIGERGGLNLYAFVDDNSANAFDLFGLAVPYHDLYDSLEAAIKAGGEYALEEAKIDLAVRIRAWEEEAKKYYPFNKKTKITFNDQKPTMREYGGKVCRKCVSENGITKFKYYFAGTRTEPNPVPGTFQQIATNLAPSCLRGDQKVGWYHSHPNDLGASGEDEHFATHSGTGGATWDDGKGGMETEIIPGIEFPINFPLHVNPMPIIGPWKEGLFRVDRIVLSK